MRPRPEQVLPIYLDSAADFNKKIAYKDGQPVYIKNGVDPTKWDIYTTRRTDNRQRYAVELISTGVTTP